jgi:hypothetical protein
MERVLDYSFMNIVDVAGVSCSLFRFSLRELARALARRVATEVRVGVPGDHGKGRSRAAARIVEEGKAEYFILLPHLRAANENIQISFLGDILFLLVSQAA